MGNGRTNVLAKIQIAHIVERRPNSIQFDRLQRDAVKQLHCLENKQQNRADEPPIQGYLNAITLKRTS